MERTDDDDEVDEPGHGVLETITMSNCLVIIDMRTCSIAFSIYVTIVYSSLIVSMICVTSRWFKAEFRRRINEENAQRQQEEATQAGGQTPTDATPPRRRSLLTSATLEHLSLADPGVISYLSCFSLPVIFGIGNLIAIFRDDEDFMEISIIILTVVIAMMLITSCSIALQNRRASTMLWYIAWACVNVYGVVVLWSYYEQLKEKKKEWLTE